MERIPVKMNQSKSKHIYTGQEAALGYALSAERIFNNDHDFLNQNPAVIPIFVSQLFQSLEISIKHAGIESGLFTEGEARARTMRSGHGIKELAALAVEKLGGEPFVPILMAMTHFNVEQHSQKIIRLMICGDDFEKTRECYASRCLGYGQVADGDFALVSDIPAWIRSVKETAENLPKTIEIIRQWKASPSKSKVFAIWN
jgi:hypothetical protein